MKKHVKKASLQFDEFAPSKHKENFFSLPHGIAASETLSSGAKLLYATLYTLAQKHDTAFATKEALQKYLGNPSKSSLFRWQKELVNEGLIRVLQKGRGLSNNYYFLRHPLLGNAEVGEFEPGPRKLYRDRQHGTQTIVTEEEGLFIFEDRLREWYEASCRGEFRTLPEPGIKISPAKRRELELKWQQLYAEAIISGTAKIALPDEVDTSDSAGDDLNYSEASSSNPEEDLSLKLSDEPSQLISPTGKVIYGPSSRECYEAAMKRRKEREAAML